MFYDDDPYYGPYSDDDYLIDGVGFADPGGTSALRAATISNPRNLPCPTCEMPNRLTPADRAAGRVRSSRLIHPGATLVDFGIVNNVWECTDWLIVGRKTGPKLGGRTSLKEKQNTSIYVVRNCLHEGRHWFICLTSMKRYT